MSTPALSALQRAGVQPTSLTADSRQVVPGELYVALRGTRADGRDFIPAAIAAGACAVLCEDPAPEGRYHIPVMHVPGLRSQLGPLADAVLGRPSTRLDVFGVTGTNGKTSISQWLAHALCAHGTSCGIIGTLGCGMPGQLTESPNTTPDVISVHRQLAAFADSGAGAAAMEVSSIGLDQGRTDAVHFHTALFSNLTRDHLDYHGDMAAYARAKERLLESEGLTRAVINADDMLGAQLVERHAPRLDLIACTLLAPAVPGRRSLRAVDIDLAQGLRFVLEFEGARAPVNAALVGRFNVSNLLLVAGALLHAGLDLDEIALRLSALEAPPGRMQRLGGRHADEPLVVVDYAHTPDALEKALQALRPVAQARGGRLICLFGCGGDRDPGKRPHMAEAACAHSDRIWITSDNPRSENPERILDQIQQGLSGAIAWHRETDRETAVRAAIAQSAGSDVILLAGKGHEPYLEVAGHRQPYSDLAAAKRALSERSSHG